MKEIMRWYFVLFALALLQPLLVRDVGAAERRKPVLIGALTESWGPTPRVGGIREGH